MTDQNFRRNYRLGVWNGIAMHVADAFISETTVLPSFISNLTPSKILIGLAGSMRRASWPLPQAVVAGYLESRDRKLPLYRTTAYLRVFAMITLSITTLLLGSHLNLLLLLFFAAFSIYSISAGIAGLPYMDIVAKTIPSKIRGSYFGTRLFLGGLLATFCGYLVKEILLTFSFPLNYGFLFLIATFFITLGVFLFSLVAEPVQSVEKEKKGSLFNLREGKMILKMDKNYQRLCLTRILLGIGAMSFPFYILYLRKIFPIPEGSIGLFLSAELVGTTFTNLFWGNLSNRKGNRIVLMITAFVSIFIPLIAFALTLIPLPTFTPSLILFFLMGGVKSGIWVGYPNFLIDISPAKKRPTYIGFMNTLIAPILFLPTLGGGIVDLSSYEVLFSLSLLSSPLALLFAYHLKDPRKEER